MKIEKLPFGSYRIRSYHAIIKYLSDRFKSLRISEPEAEDVQVEINHYCVGRSPKTTRNAHGFISAVLALYKPNLILNTTLPQPEANLINGLSRLQKQSKAHVKSTLMMHWLNLSSGIKMYFKTIKNPVKSTFHTHLLGFSMNAGSGT